MRSMRDWEIYERFIARLLANQLSTNYCVTVNARVPGSLSGTERQIDVLVDCRHDTDNSRRIIVDAKARTRKIDVTHVEAFEGLMKDIGATHGILVYPAGHTNAAEKRAQNMIRIRLVPLEYLEHFDPSSWDRCQKPKCKRGFVFWDGYPELTLDLLPLEEKWKAGERVLHPLRRQVRPMRSISCPLFGLRGTVLSRRRVRP